MDIGAGFLHCGGPVTDEDLERARPWSLDDEIESVSDGWVVLMPRECMDDELRALHELLPEG